jgi:SAM-dependent methyltransferase
VSAGTSAIDEHNRRQRDYFERSPKHGMRPTGSPYLRRHVDALIEFAPLAPGQRVLEAGCGMGRYTLLLAERGIRVEGLDLSPVLLDRLRAFARGRFDIPLHCGDVLDPPSGLEGGFDAVVGLFALHHMHDLRGCLSSMAELARPGAPIAFLEPNPFNPSYYVQMALRPGMSWQGDGGIVRMRRRILFEAMAEARIEAPRLRRIGAFPPALANRPGGARLEEVITRRLPEAIQAFQLVGGRAV